MKNFVFIIAIFIITSIIFFPILFLYFFQDDFFLLAVSRVGSLADFFKLFIPAKEVIWYRPLSSQVFFFIGQSLFGLNPFFYHLIMLITHLLNIYLVFLFTKEISKNEKIALISSFIYGVSSVHFLSLAWISTYSFVLGPTFVLLTLLFYLKSKYINSFIFYCLGLLTSEVNILTIIPLLFLSLFFKKKNEIRNNLLRLLLNILVVVFIIFLRKVIFPVSYQAAYTIMFDPLGMFFLLKFYFFRTLGIPMLIKDLSNNLLKFIILFLSIAVMLVPVILISYKKINLKLFWLSIIIYLSFLSIFLFLPFHYAPYYLSFALIGAVLFFGITSGQGNQLIRGIFILSYLILQLITIKQTYETHWVVKRAHLAKELVKEKNFEHPVGSEEYFALGAGVAEKIFGE